MTTTMKAVAAAASLLSLLAATLAGDNEGLVNARAGRGMGGGLVKFMMVSQKNRITSYQSADNLF